MECGELAGGRKRISLGEPTDIRVFTNSTVNPLTA